LIRAPLTDPKTAATLAGYGWVFPIAPTLVNVGVGLFPSQISARPPSLRALFDALVRELECLPLFRDWSPVSRVSGGRLPSGIDGLDSQPPGFLFVGDAAGLVDPFTGEGISAALSSGEAAAEFITDALRSERRTVPLGAGPAFASWARSRFGARFRLGRQFVRSHTFLWKVLQDTLPFSDDLYESLRTEALEYVGDFQRAIERPSFATDSEVGSAFMAEIVALEARLVAILEQHHGLIARLSMRLLRVEDTAWRLALVRAAGLLGDVDLEDVRVTAAAVELAALARLMHADVRDGPGRVCEKAGSIETANQFAIMCGGILMTEAMKALVPLGARLVEAASLLGFEAAALSLDDDADRADSSFELASAVGCRLARLDGQTEKQMRRIGQSVGKHRPWPLRQEMASIEIESLPPSTARTWLREVVAALRIGGAENAD
jgi:hypothetical protein